MTCKQKKQQTLSEALSVLIDKGLSAREAMRVPRDYLGASSLNSPCQRALQYAFFHTPKDPGKSWRGRTLRIFEAGHVFESLTVSWLRGAGITLLTENKDGEQFGFSALGGKLKGHIDGVITDAPDHLGWSFPMLFECKSLNQSNWNAIAKKGLTMGNATYAGQVAMYQAYMSEQFPGLAEHPALFAAINKNTAQLVFECVPFDAALAQATSDRGVRILDACVAHELLPRISRDAQHKECQWCPWQRRCWEAETIAL